MQQQEQTLVRGLAHAGLVDFDRLRVLDVGCGLGSLLLTLFRHGFAPENLHGIDLMEQFVERARQRLPPQVSLRVGSATQLDYQDGYFDVVTQCGVFSSVFDRNMAQQMAAEMWRVLARAGAIVWIDMRYRNPWNPDVRGVRLGEVRQLFPHAICRARTILLAPPIARRAVPVSVGLAQALAMLPPLRSHLFAMLIKPARERSESQ
jgi:ubiquinone/menaquinone biosynthesis C-methylase UbiE